MSEQLQHPLPQRRSYSKNEPWIQHVWDSSSLGAFLRCPRRYFLQQICGFRPFQESLDLKFGTLVHLAMETYNKVQPVEGHHEGQVKGLEAILTEAWNRPSAELLKAAPETKGWYWTSASKNKNLWNALRAFIWHTEQFGMTSQVHTVELESEVTLESGLKTVTKLPLIEFPFQFDLELMAKGQPVTYCGHLDRVVDSLNGRWIVDYKTTTKTMGSYFFDAFQPSTQLPGYAIAGKIIFPEPIMGVIIDGFQIGVDFVRCGRGHLLIGEEKANEWLENVHEWIQEAIDISVRFKPLPAETLPEWAGKNMLQWRMNTESCFICPFKGVCATTPSLRAHILQGAYQVSFWDPLARQQKETEE